MIPSTRSKMKEDDKDEVEEMLRAAQDEVLLKLSVDSHTTRLPSDSLLPDDLYRRFQSLKSNPQPTRRNQPPAIRDASAEPVNDGDLFERFAALKAPPSSSGGGGAGLDPGGEQDKDEDEVERIIRWAQDAARLDPSPPSDDDDGVEDEEEDDSSDDEKADACRKGQRRGK